MSSEHHRCLSKFWAPNFALVFPAFWQYIAINKLFNIVVQFVVKLKQGEIHS